MSRYKGVDLFGSGPHRFAEGWRGEVLMSELFQTPPNSGSRYVGPAETSVVVRGRLVANTDAELWEQVAAVHAYLVHPPEPGLLEDGRGRQWPDMSFVRFAVADRVDRGRVCSLGYVARFVDLRQYPQE